MSAARDRLRTGYYNNRELVAVTNPGGMARNGHRTNFVLALQDVGDVGEEIVTSNDAAVAAIAADNAATLLAIQQDNLATALAVDADATAADGSKTAAAGSAGAAAGSATTASNAATDAKRTVANNFPDRLDATGSWFTEALNGDPGTVASPTGAAISNVGGYGYEYTKANAQGQLFTKGVLAAVDGKFYEVEAEVEWTVKGGAETPSLTVGVQGLSATFANAGGQIQAPLQAVAAIGVQTIKYRFGYAAPTGGAAWPSPGVSIWLRPYVLFNRKSDNSGAVTASTARVRRLTVRDVTGVVLAEIQAAAAAASAASIAQATDAEAIAGTGVGLMNAPRVAMAIGAQALNVGAVLESAANPGSRFLRTDASLYLNSAYPALRAVLGPYKNPLVSRLSSPSASSRLYRANGLWLAWAYTGSSWSLYSSPDLVTWTLRTAPTTSPGPIVYGAGLYVWTDQSTNIRTSPDLATWTARALPSGFTNINQIARGATKFVASGTKSGGNPGIMYSSDGITWTGSASTITNSVYAPAYNPTGGRWICTANSGKIYRSLDDGVTWSDMGSLVAGNPTLAEVGGGVFAVVTTSSPYVYYSTDGQTWTGATGSYYPASPSNISYDGAAFVFGYGSGQTIGRTSDFASWTNETTTGVYPYFAFKAGTTVNDPFVIAAGDGIYSGLDLSTTQFQVPNIASGNASTLCYIKAS